MRIIPAVTLKFPSRDYVSRDCRFPTTANKAPKVEASTPVALLFVLALARSLYMVIIIYTINNFYNIYIMQYTRVRSRTMMGV